MIGPGRFKLCLSPKTPKTPKDIKNKVRPYEVKMLVNNAFFGVGANLVFARLALKINTFCVAVHQGADLLALLPCLYIRLHFYQND